MKLSAKYFKNTNSFIEYASNTEKYLLLFASNTEFSLNEFNEKDINITAAIFPQIIMKNVLHDKGLISIKIEKNMNVEFIHDITEYKFDESRFENVKGVISILEGFCTHNESFLTTLFDNLNINTNIIGGAAGVIEDGNKPVLFNNNGFFSSAAILVTLKDKISSSAKHGLKYLKGPYIITSSNKNVIETINYENAFDVYKKVVEEDSLTPLTQENFLDLAKNYPLGIVKYENEEIIRDPIAFEDNKLILAGEVSTNSMINILKADVESMINAAKNSTLESTNYCEKDCTVIMFNCIGRKNFLEKSFQDELDAVNKACTSSSIVGVTTVGEISNSGNRYINFLNKTCVVGGICN